MNYIFTGHYYFTVIFGDFLPASFYSTLNCAISFDVNKIRFAVTVRFILKLLLVKVSDRVKQKRKKVDENLRAEPLLCSHIDS